MNWMNMLKISYLKWYALKIAISVNFSLKTRGFEAVLILFRFKNYTTFAAL